ncbi:MAG: YqgE/AlgH family protein [Acidobacteriota bacterium]|nr:YqgE/AlgH family protein [Acidobacteriota bacterium]
MNCRSRALVLASLTAALLLPAAASAQFVEPLAPGKLLVASEDLLDSNFSRTVVLLLHYDESGAMGVVLNRPSRVRLEHFLPDLEWASRANEPVHVGGPVAVLQVRMLFSTGERHADQVRVIGTVHAGWDLTLLEQMVTEPDPDDRFRVYAGHAGWAAGQLDAEVRQMGWYIFPASEAVIFTDGEEELWELFISRTKTRVARR